MADTLGLSLRTFQRLETNRSPIDINIIYKLCESYDIPLFDLINPDIKTDELPEARYYDNPYEMKKEEFFQNKTDLIELRNKVIEIAKENPQKLTKINELKEFEDSPYYLFVSNLYFTVGNAKARAVGGIPDDKFRTLKTFKDASKNIKSWDILLKYGFPAYTITSEHLMDNKHLSLKSYCFFYANEESDEPFIFGAFELR